jgi:hypothetical protein
MIYEKKNINQNQNFSSFRPIFDFELNGKRSRAEPSQAENLSARAMARASSARTHHYPAHQIVMKNTSVQNNPM